MKRFLPIVVLCVFLGAALPVNAGERTLSVNGNDQNAVWFITGEASLVMNGFDLNASGIVLPAVIDRVSIAVDTPTPGVPIDVVI